MTTVLLLAFGLAVELSGFVMVERLVAGGMSDFWAGAAGYAWTTVVIAVGAVIQMARGK